MGCPDVDLYYCSWGWFRHPLSQGLRTWQVSLLFKDGVSKRKDTVGLTAEVDHVATRAQLELKDTDPSKLDAYGEGCLVSTLSGAVRGMNSLVHVKPDKFKAPHCKLCAAGIAGRVIETETHLFHYCPATDLTRQQFREELDACGFYDGSGVVTIDGAATATLECGIIPEDPRILQAICDIPGEDYGLPNVTGVDPP